MGGPPRGGWGDMGPGPDYRGPGGYGPQRGYGPPDNGPQRGYGPPDHSAQRGYGPRGYGAPDQGAERPELSAAVEAHERYRVDYNKYMEATDPKEREMYRQYCVKDLDVIQKFEALRRN